MPGPAEEFASAAPGVATATSVQTGDVLHFYRGELTGVDGTVRIFTPAPETTTEAVETAFTQAAGQWHNPSTHPNIVTVHERGRTPRPWLATESVDGSTLASVQSELSLAGVQALANDVAEALRNAGLYNTVHLNLTPKSIWVQFADSGLTAVVGGWGLLRECYVAAGESAVTRFTAPELVDDPDSGAEETDVYGLGAVTYYALTGQPPVTADDVETAIRAGDVTPPSDLSPEIPGAVDDVVLTALARNPSARQDSAYAFRTELNQAFPTELGDTGTVGSANKSPSESQQASEDRQETDQQPEPSDEQSDDQPEPTDQDDGDTSLLTTRRVAIAGVGGGLLGSFAAVYAQTRGNSPSAGSDESTNGGRTDTENAGSDGQSGPESTGSGDQDGSGTNGDGSDTNSGSAMSQEAVVEEFYSRVDSGDATGANRLIHDAAPLTELSEEQISPYRERMDITTSGTELVEERDDRAVVRTVLKVSVDGDASQTQESFVEVRRQDGEWRLWEISQDRQEVPNGTGTSQLEVVTAAGIVTDGRIQLVRIVIKPVADAEPVDLRQTVLQWIDASGRYELTYGDTRPAFAVEAVQDDDESLSGQSPTLDDARDRAALVVAPTEFREQEFGEGESAVVRIRTASGGTTEVRLDVPSTLPDQSVVEL